MERDKRSFTLIRSEVKLPEGSVTRYISSGPASAAKKAARRIYKETNTRKKQISITLRETTQSGNKRNVTYTYIVSKMKLEKPKVITVAGKEITYQYEYTSKLCK